MKTERLTLLISPDDKAALAARASSLDMSISELIRRAALEYDPADAEIMDELAVLLPELQDMAERIERDHKAWKKKQAAFDRKLADIRSPAYRNAVRAELAADPTIDWAGVEALFGGAITDRAA